MKKKIFFVNESQCGFDRNIQSRKTYLAALIYIEGVMCMFVYFLEEYKEKFSTQINVV